MVTDLQHRASVLSRTALCADAVLSPINDKERSSLVIGCFFVVISYSSTGFNTNFAPLSLPYRRRGYSAL